MLRMAVMEDSTTHGGVLIEGTPRMKDHGKRVVLMGHAATCPICKAPARVIASGKSFIRCEGKAVAMMGDDVVCGCPTPARIIASNGHIVRSEGGGSGASQVASVPPGKSDTDASKEMNVQVRRTGDHTQADFSPAHDA